MEHRTTRDDITPPWYKRGAYIIILAIVVFIVAYGIYVALSPHSAPPPPSVPSAGFPNYSAPPG